MSDHRDPMPDDLPTMHVVDACGAEGYLQPVHGDHEEHYPGAVAYFSIVWGPESLGVWLKPEDLRGLIQMATFLLDDEDEEEEAD